MQALTLSDVVTPDGKFIDKESVGGRRNTSFQTRYTWPHQNKVAHKYWKGGKKC